MDSLANWASIGAFSASLGNLDRNLDFASLSNAGLNSVKPPNLDCDGRVQDLNGMALNSDWMKLMGLSSAVPNGEGDRAGLTISLGSADEEFGHWRPVYDEKTRPTFSVTGTEIWQTQKTNPAPTTEKTTTTDWNLTDATKTSAAAVTAMESVKCLLRDEETGSEKNQNVREDVWHGSSSDVPSNSGGSMLDVGSNVDSNAGWGTTPICQERPWDLNQDHALLESVAAPTGRQDVQKPRDSSQDCGLDLWRSSLMAGEPGTSLTNQKSRGFDSRSLELFAKSDTPDGIALQLELQKLALMESQSPDGLASRSRRGSSVSSIDGISLSSLVGRGDRKDPGVESSCETPSWVDRQKKPLSEWNHGNAGLHLYTGLQSPSGWSSLSGSEKTPPVVDNGTSVWSKAASQDKVGDDTLAWVKMLRTQSYPPPPSVFDIDMSVPPPPLNAPPVMPHGVVAPAPPGLNIPPMLSNLQPSSNLTGRKLGSPLSYMAGPGGLVSPSADISDKSWPFLLQQQPVERQRPWTGSQWNSSDQWNSMQRKNQYEAAARQNDALNTSSLSNDHLRGGFNLHPMQYKDNGFAWQTTSTVHSRAPQTRSKLIQQLVSMGFKREDAQNALITHNMDLKKALGDLMTKRTMVTPSQYYDPRLNSLVGGGQLANNNNTDNIRDALRNSLGGLSGHGMGGGGSGGLADAPLDFSKLISSSTGWDALMQQTPSSPLQMLQSGRNPLSTGPMLPPLLHSSLQLPPSMRPTGRAHETSTQETLRQLSDLALGRKITEGSRSSLQTDAELLQLFAKTLAVSSSMVPSRDNTSAVYSYGNELPVGLKLPDHLGSAMPSGLFLSPTLASGPGRSASVELNAVPSPPDGFGLESSLIGRQLSLNLASSTNQDAATGMGRSDAIGSLQFSPVDVKTSQADLQKMAPPKLEIKEFIPGVPWKGAHDTGDQAPRRGLPVVAVALKDDWLSLTKEVTVLEDSAQKCLTSRWIELKNVSDDLDDATLHDLCARHGQMKVFARQMDGSLLISYINLDDAVNAQAALNESQLNGVPITAEFIKDWTSSGASATTSESDSLGFMTANGLWIPPDADGKEPAFYGGGGADDWCEEYDEAQPEEELWNDKTAFESATSSTAAAAAFDGSSSQKKQ